jgi:ABC-2 type transport system ATP-binding protein
LQQSELPEKLRVREALTLFASFYPDPADPDDLLEVMGLAPAANRSWHVLSGGQRQRLSIALALIGNPRIAVLDELTTGLDPAARHQTWDLIESVRDRGTTILLVTHFMPEAERLCDRLAFIDNGRISALDTPAGIVARLSTEPDEGGRLNGRYGMAFRPSVDVDDRLLTNLPEVTTLRRDGGRITVTGTGDLVSAVTTALARNGVIAHQLRVEQPSLDDAFVTLTERNDR